MLQVTLWQAGQKGRGNILTAVRGVPNHREGRRSYERKENGHFKSRKSDVEGQSKKRTGPLLQFFPPWFKTFLSLYIQGGEESKGKRSNGGL